MAAAEPYLNPLSCQRCKARKIKCNRVEPVCNRCEAADADCVYVSRRPRTKRPKHAPPSGSSGGSALSQILARLEHLEKREAERNAPSLTGSPSDDNAVPSTPPTADRAPHPLLSGLSSTHSALPIVVDRICRGDCDGSLPSDELPQRDLRDAIAHAARRLEMISEQLGLSPGSANMGIPALLVRRWTDMVFDAYEQCENKVPLEREYSHKLGDLLNMPHVMVDPAALLVYYNNMFIGMLMDVESLAQRSFYSHYLYLIILRIAQRWPVRREAIPMDVHAGTSLTWLCQHFLEADLAWKFHTKACDSARSLGYFDLDGPDDEMDVTAIDDKTRDDVSVKKEKARFAFWMLLHVDCMFRMQHNKPGNILPGTFRVNFPDLKASDDAVSQGAYPAFFIVAMRLAFVWLEHQDYLASAVAEDPAQRNLAIEHHVSQIYAIIDEWGLEHRFEHAFNGIESWLFCIVLFTAYTCIIVAGRHMSKPKGMKHGIPSSAIDAARKLIGFSKKAQKANPVIANWGISFTGIFPCFAITILCSHIIQTEQIQEAQNDLALLQWLDEAIDAAVEERPELTFLQQSVGTLYTVCRKAILRRITRQAAVSSGFKANDPSALGSVSATPSPEQALLELLDDGSLEFTSLISTSDTFTIEDWSKALYDRVVD